MYDRPYRLRQPSSRALLYALRSLDRILPSCRTTGPHLKTRSKTEPRTYHKLDIARPMNFIMDVERPSRPALCDRTFPLLRRRQVPVHSLVRRVRKYFRCGEWHFGLLLSNQSRFLEYPKKCRAATVRQRRSIKGAEVIESRATTQKQHDKA